MNWTLISLTTILCAGSGYAVFMAYLFVVNRKTKPRGLLQAIQKGQPTYKPSDFTLEKFEEMIREIRRKPEHVIAGRNFLMSLTNAEFEEVLRHGTLRGTKIDLSLSTKDLKVINNRAKKLGLKPIK